MPRRGGPAGAGSVRASPAATTPRRRARTTFDLAYSSGLTNESYCALRARATNALPGSVVRETNGSSERDIAFLSVGDDGTITGNDGYILATHGVTLSVKTADGRLSRVVDCVGHTQ